LFLSEQFKTSYKCQQNATINVSKRRNTSQCLHSLNRELCTSNTYVQEILEGFC